MVISDEAAELFFFALSLRKGESTLDQRNNFGRKILNRMFAFIATGVYRAEMMKYLKRVATFCDAFSKTCIYGFSFVVNISKV